MSFFKNVFCSNKDTDICEGELTGHYAGINCLKLLTNSRLASGSDDYTIKIWDLSDFNYIFSLYGHTKPVIYMKLIPSNKLRMLSGSTDGTIRVWNLNNAECLKTIKGNILAICFKLVSDSLLASGTKNNLIKLWNFNTGECVRVLNGHSDWIIRLKLIANDRLVSGSRDDIIKIWKIEKGLFDLKKCQIIEIVFEKSSRTLGDFLNQL